ncbi:prepilin peptidase [Leifsonia sp. McL0607]|uniref:prepilin peptidase n=1 Tax=Leifsonia sp. McL0607 TaxID=3415672 RepID=UPI003CF73EB1
MGVTTIRIALAAGLSVALLGAQDAGPAAVGALYVAAVTAALVRYDLRERRLPNALVLPGLAFVAVGAVWSVLSGAGGIALVVAAALCSLGVLLAFLVLACGGGLGMGDVKLAALLASALAALVAERGPPGEAVAAVAAWVVASLVLGGLAAGMLLGSRVGTTLGGPVELPFGPVLLVTFWAVALGW